MNAASRILEEILPGSYEGTNLNHALSVARGNVTIRVNEHSSHDHIAGVVWDEYVSANPGLSTKEQAQLQIIAIWAAHALGVRGHALRELYRKAELIPAY